MACAIVCSSDGPVTGFPVSQSVVRHERAMFVESPAPPLALCMHHIAALSRGLTVLLKHRSALKCVRWDLQVQEARMCLKPYKLLQGGRRCCKAACVVLSERPLGAWLHCRAQLCPRGCSQHTSGSSQREAAVGCEILPSGRPRTTSSRGFLCTQEGGHRAPGWAAAAAAGRSLSSHPRCLCECFSKL